MSRHSEVELINQVPESAWKSEMENKSLRYHKVAAFVAIIFDPIFAITDYYNIPDRWETLLYIRLSVALLTLFFLFFYERLNLHSRIIVLVPFLLISLQNAFTYNYLGPEDLLGHNLNYIALLIGAAMFLAWEWKYSLAVLVASILVTTVFVSENPSITMEDFFVKGGLLLLTSGVFMFMLIKTRYDLSAREIKARLALQVINREIEKRNREIHSQNAEIQAQAEEIKGINENLERIVQDRTVELEKKNRALEEYAFINAHKLRSPVASILGLSNLAKKITLSNEDRSIMDHLQRSTEELDAIVASITKTIEKAE